MGVLWELMVCRPLLQVTVLKCVLLLWESFFGTHIRAAITRWCCYTPSSHFLLVFAHFQALEKWFLLGLGLWYLFEKPLKQRKVAGSSS